MECIETTLNRVAKYCDHLENLTKNLLPDNMETEEFLKTFSKYRRLYEIISKLFFPNTSKKKYFEAYLNETYTSLRKLDMMITTYDKVTIYSRDKSIRDVKQCLSRNEYLIDDYLKTLKKFEEKYKKRVPKTFNPSPLLDNQTCFLLSIKCQIYLPLSCENIFVNMVQYKDQVYYVETNDMISFFYFYRTEDGWYWSPPKKTDKEDIWIECPETRINEGYWKDKIIPGYIAEFIKWLDFFFPNIPEFYLKELGDEDDENKKKKKKKKKNKDIEDDNKDKEKDKEKDKDKNNEGNNDGNKEEDDEKNKTKRSKKHKNKEKHKDDEEQEKDE